MRVSRLINDIAKYLKIFPENLQISIQERKHEDNA